MECSLRRFIITEMVSEDMVAHHEDEEHRLYNTQESAPEAAHEKITGICHALNV